MDDKGVISDSWMKWFQKISIQLSSTTPITGAKAGNAALTSLVTTLAAKGIITDQTT